MRPDYTGMFNRFFSNQRRMSSTYKPVFLRALLDVGDLHDARKAKGLAGRQWLEIRDGSLLVDLNFIAVRFAKYYWDMEYSFRLRQSHDPNDANITRLVRAAHRDGRKPPTVKRLASEEMGGFRAKVIAKSIRPEVLVHLLNDMDGLYRKVDANTVSLDGSVIKFLHDHKIMLRNGINNALTRYLERINRLTPQIANKVDYIPGPRPQLDAKMRLLLMKWQDSRCFYCGRAVSTWHVDHVIPYNFVFATDLYNCTLACRQCNCQKSDMLPDRDLFCGVVERNGGITEYLDLQKTTYDEEAYVHLYETCKSEYHTGPLFSR